MPVRGVRVQAAREEPIAIGNLVRILLTAGAVVVGEVEKARGRLAARVRAGLVVRSPPVAVDAARDRVEVPDGQLVLCGLAHSVVDVEEGTELRGLDVREGRGDGRDGDAASEPRLRILELGRDGMESEVHVSRVGEAEVPCRTVDSEGCRRGLATPTLRGG